MWSGLIHWSSFEQQQKNRRSMACVPFVENNWEILDTSQNQIRSFCVTHNTITETIVLNFNLYPMYKTNTITKSELLI